MKKAIVAAIFFGAAMSAHCAGKTIVKWEFPIEYSQAGLPFADAKSGILVWGGSNTLNVTVSRVDLWDHRGGYEWTEEQSYANIRDFLQSRNEKGLNDLYKKEVAEGKTDKEFKGLAVVSYSIEALDESDFDDVISDSDRLALLLPFILAILIIIAIVLSIRLGLGSIRRLDFNNDATMFKN